MNLAFGASDEWAAAVYGETHPNTVRFMQNQFSQLGNIVTDAGKRFYETSMNAFNHFNGSEALNFARRVVSKLGNAVEVQRITDYHTLKDFQGASVLMGRWLMANPVVRERWQAQQCDGYSDTYTDMHPGKLGANHYDYQRVMNGVGVEGEDGATSWTTYLDDLKEGDRELVLEEQISILRSWTRMDALMALAKDDPSSSTGGKL